CSPDERRRSHRANAVSPSRPAPTPPGPAAPTCRGTRAPALERAFPRPAWGDPIPRRGRLAGRGHDEMRHYGPMRTVEEHRQLVASLLPRSEPVPRPLIDSLGAV